jgi:5-methylthioadenosine/S-adenosylhomocysteine deaminase
MRDRNLLTIEEAPLMKEADEYARKIDKFLLKREQSVLSKLVAIGGASEVESFEVQTKVPIEDRQAVIDHLDHPDIDILYYRHYQEYDTYFSFDDPDQGLLRYREDEFINDEGEISSVRYRLTLVGPTREHQFPSDVLLSRSRFIAPATHSLRFYREYFNPTGETFIEKDRLRWRILYKGTEFYINLDEVSKPDLGSYIEIKARTWSINDAESKAELALELLQVLGVSGQRAVTQDYIEFINQR